MKKKIVIGLFALTLFANVSGAGIITIVPNSQYHSTSTSAPTAVSSATVTTTSAATTDSTSWIGRLMSLFSLWL
jgi:hypothetical protein